MHPFPRYNTISDHNWSGATFIARPLCQRWPGKLQPIIDVNASRLLLAAGNTIYSYGFGPSTTHEEAPPVFSEHAYPISIFHPNRDITALVSLPHQKDRTVCLGYADGSLEVIALPSNNSTSSPEDAQLLERYHFHGGSLVEHISVSSTHLLSLSSSGAVAFYSLASARSELDPQIIELGVRSWSTYLAADSSYAVFGSTSRTPLSVRYIDSSGLSLRTSVHLAPVARMERSSAVYAIESAPQAAPWGASDQIVVSGWYDGVVRVHDLRSSSRTMTQTDTHTSAAALLPTLSFSDPWSYEPIYSVACGGGNMAHIAAGSARHSVVAFWDVRAPMKGWSVHAPGNDSSPVYSLVMDGSRVFGANESRGFVFDFGSGVSESTYPPIFPDVSPSNRRRRGIALEIDHGMRRQDKNSVGIYVTKYSHYRNEVGSWSHGWRVS